MNQTLEAVAMVAVFDARPTPRRRVSRPVRCPTWFGLLLLLELFVAGQVVLMVEALGWTWSDALWQMGWEATRLVLWLGQPLVMGYGPG